MKKFEYKTVEFKRDFGSQDFTQEVVTRLNQLGDEGWELVSFLTNPQWGSSKYAIIGVSIGTVAVLKRSSRRSIE